MESWVEENENSFTQEEHFENLISRFSGIQQSYSTGDKKGKHLNFQILLILQFLHLSFVL